LSAPVAMPRSVVQAAPARVVGDTRRCPAHGARATAAMGRIGADPFTVPPEPPRLDRRVDAGAGDHGPQLADRVQAHHFGRRPGESPSPGQHNPPRQLPLAHAGLHPDRNRASRRPNARWRRRTAPTRARRDDGSESGARSGADRLPAFVGCLPAVSRRLPRATPPSGLVTAHRCPAIATTGSSTQPSCPDLVIMSRAQSRARSSSGSSTRRPGWWPSPPRSSTHHRPPSSNISTSRRAGPSVVPFHQCLRRSTPSTSRTYVRSPGAPEPALISRLGLIRLSGPWQVVGHLIMYDRRNRCASKVFG
jgi:hypothetical protein